MGTQRIMIALLLGARACSGAFQLAPRVFLGRFGDGMPAACHLLRRPDVGGALRPPAQAAGAFCTQMVAAGNRRSRGGLESGRGGGRGGQGGRSGRGVRGRRGSARSPPPSQKSDRGGLSRREWELAVEIGGNRKSPSALAQLFALAKKGEFGKLEDLWDREGTSKNEVKRRIKAIRRMQGEDEAARARVNAPSARELALSSELRCIHFGACSGCSAEAGLAQTPVMQEARRFFEALLPPSQTFSIYKGKSHRWRTLAKLAVQPSGSGGVAIGLYQAGSHDVLAIPKCRVHHPSINDAVAVLEREMLDLGVSGYNEALGIGHLRYVQLMVERHTHRVQLTLVWNADSYRQASPTVQLLVKKLKAYPIFHSIWINFRTGPGNVIFNRREQAWHLAHGPPRVWETLLPTGANLSFPITPTMFRQGNLEQLEAMLQATAPFIPAGAAVCELYAGAGMIGLSTAAHSCQWLRCSDENPANVDAFLRVKRSLPPSVAAKVTYTAASAEEAIEQGQVDGAQVLIVDPPRKGLDLVARWLAREAPASLTRIIYISCGYKALETDTAMLLSGRWKLQHAEGHVFFPGSDHIETLAVFDRSVPV